MAKAPPPGVKSRRSYNLVKTFLIFNDDVTSLSKSSTANAPSHDPSPNPKRSAANTFFLRELWRGEWLLLAVLSRKNGRKMLTPPSAP